MRAHLDAWKKRAGQKANVRISYEKALRTLGQYLDARDSTMVHVLEAINGFTVRYQERADDPASALVSFTKSDLLALDEEARRNRRIIRLLSGRSGKAGHVRGSTYQQMFRALGSQLDAAEAYGLLIDEVEEGFLVTYQHLQSRDGYQSRKQLLILGDDALEIIMTDARARREHRQAGKVSLLVSSAV